MIDLIEWPTTNPLRRWSRMVRLYWWLIALLPPFSVLLALDTARTARSADEALGLTFFLAPFLLGALGLGALVAYRAWISTAITRGERAILVVMGLASVPLFLLVSAIAHYFGGWPREYDPVGRSVTMALTLSWVLLAFAARRTLHQGAPARWHQIWWLLLPLPLISFFVAAANLFPSKPTDDPSPYPLWPFLAGAVAAMPLLAYRALFSPTVTRLERIFIILACLTVLLLFLFFMGAWHLLGSTPSEARSAEWALFYALSAGWMALAVATRLKLKG